MSSSEGTNPQIRNVSFNLEKDILGPDSKLGSTSPEMNKTPPKSALKRRQSHMLPPPDQYQHSDPLLRRLRLIDGHGKPVNLKKAFRDTKIVIFYFGSQWNARETKGCQKYVTSICRKYPHEVKTVYISVDVEAQNFELATRNKPWFAMVWNDGSSDDPSLESESSSSTESFLLAGDTDLDKSVVQEDTAGTSYVRPFSRVYMADKFDVLMTPTLVVYHVPTQRVLDKHVRLSRLRSSRVEDTMSVWLDGRVSPSMNVVDMLYIAPWTVVFGFIALLYLLLLVIGGDKYNLQRILASWN